MLKSSTLLLFCLLNISSIFLRNWIHAHKLQRRAIMSIKFCHTIPGISTLLKFNGIMMPLLWPAW